MAPSKPPLNPQPSTLPLISLLHPRRYQVNTEGKSAIVHIYQDGSVMVAHPGIEMGQGLVTKVMQTAAFTLGQLLPESQRPMSVDLFRCGFGLERFLP